jgi:hypothetical protein
MGATQTEEAGGRKEDNILQAVQWVNTLPVRRRELSASAILASSPSGAVARGPSGAAASCQSGAAASSPSGAAASSPSGAAASSPRGATCKAYARAPREAPPLSPVLPTPSAPREAPPCEPTPSAPREALLQSYGTWAGEKRASICRFSCSNRGKRGSYSSKFQPIST